MNVKKFSIKAILIFVISFTMPIYGRDTVYDDVYICRKNSQNIETFLHDIGIDLSTRSLKGWMRVLNNEEKRNQYGLYGCKRDDIQKLKDYIKYIKTKDTQNFDRRLK